MSMLKLYNSSKNKNYTIRNNVSYWNVILDINPQDIDIDPYGVKNGCNCKECRREIKQQEYCMICNRQAYVGLIFNNNDKKYDLSHKDDAFFYVCKDHEHDLKLHKLLDENDLYGVMNYKQRMVDEFSNTVKQANK